jgi:hypothetical protein
MNRFASCLRLAIVALGLLVAVTPALAEERPIKGSGSGGFDYDNHYLYGRAQVTHLGWAAMNVPLDPVELYDFGNVVPSSFVLFAANGAANYEHLFADIDAAFDPDLGILVATITFMGGTGRFADATGSASLLIVFDSWPLDPFQPNNTRHSFAIEGTIDY